MATETIFYREPRGELGPRGLSSIHNPNSILGEILLEIAGKVLGTGHEVGNASRVLMLGVLHGIRTRNSDQMGTIRLTSSTLLRQTADMGGDIRSAAKGAIEGAREFARETSLDADEAAWAAFFGALVAATHVGAENARKARQAARQLRE